MDSSLGCGTLKLLGRLMAEFDARSVRYVHWKSNTNIARALAGLDDFDILVHPEDRATTEAIFHSLKLIRAKSRKDHWQSGIYHYVGADVDTCVLVHVHIHYALPAGFDYDKNYVLPVVDGYLATRRKHGPVFLPEPEMEYAALVLRLVIKNGFGPFLLELPHRQLTRIRSASGGVVRGGGLAEFNDLAARVDRQRLESILATTFGFLKRSTFDLCEITIKRNDSLAAYFKASSLLETEMAACATSSRFHSFFKAFARINRERFDKARRRMFRLPAPGKFLDTGGRIFAFVGGDGAGKSTNVDALYDILRREISTIKLHIGRPPTGPCSLVAKIVAKALRLIGSRDYANAFTFFATALDRARAFRLASNLRNGGWLVVVDRVPLPGITRMDCPRIHTLGKPGLGWLACWETKLHARITGVDKLIVLKLDPRIALQRRPEDDPDELLARSGEIWNDRWFAPYATVIDTGTTTPMEVRRQVLDAAWSTCAQPFLRTELVGLSGVGKSSLIRRLREDIPNLTPSLPYWKFPATSAIGALRGLPSAIRAIATTRNPEVGKNCVQLFASAALLSRFRSTGFPATNFVLDQGPVFQYALALKEGALSAKGELAARGACREFRAIQLTASRDELFRRVNLRTNHVGRVPTADRSQFDDFCGRYEKHLGVALSAATTCSGMDADRDLESIAREILATEAAR